MSNKEKFIEFLTEEYIRRFSNNDPAYKFSAQNISPGALAKKMTRGLISGIASKDGPAIKAACKHFGVNLTYKAIKEYLSA